MNLRGKEMCDITAIDYHCAYLFHQVFHLASYFPALKFVIHIFIDDLVLTTFKKQLTKIIKRFEKEIAVISAFPRQIWSRFTQ